MYNPNWSFSETFIWLRLTCFQQNNVGKTFTEPGQMSHRWKEYGEELHSEKQENVQIDVQERESPPMKEEMLINAKCSSVDGTRSRQSSR